MNRAVFLDRDGTINADVGHITDPSLFKLIPGSVDAMNRLRDAGFLMPLITNQAGVGRGLMTEQRLRRVLDAFEALLAEEGTRLDGIYYSPYHPEEANGFYKQNSDCRKPGPGMLLKAAEDLEIDLSRSYMVGDHWTDVEAGLGAGCQSILLRTGHGPKEVARLSDRELEKAAYVADDLASAVDWILKDDR